LDSVSSVVGSYILLLFWRAWFLWNDVMHGKDTASIGVSANFLIAYAESVQVDGQGARNEVDVKGKAKIHEYHTGKEDQEVHAKRGSRQERWESPPQGWDKINTDAGYSEESGEASTGVVIRDENGEVLLTAWQMVKNCCTVKVAEAEAFLRGIQLGSEWVRQPAIVTDCVNVIRALQTKTDEHAAWEGLLKEIRAASVLLPGCTYKHARREANKAAHTLAQHAMRTKEFVVRRFDVPTCIRKIARLETRQVEGPGNSGQQPPAPGEDPCNPVKL
jgi:ribonuclease HI